MKIDPKPIEAELQELAGNCRVKVKLDKKLNVASSIRETDKGYYIRLNPNRFRTSNKLDSHLGMCREAVVR